jgi:streptogramin lyase
MTGDLQEFAGAFSVPVAIATGSDGNLWVLNDGDQGQSSISVVSTNGTVEATYQIPTLNANPQGLVLGSDGNLWFVDSGADQIGSISPAGQITEYPIPAVTANVAADPTALVEGADGAIWFTESSGQAIGRITTAGIITQIATPGLQPNSIALGSDGNIWFTDDSYNDTVDRINPDDSISPFSIPTAFAQPNDLISGPDGALYFTEGFNQAIGRVTMSGTVTESPINADMNSPNQLVFDSAGNLWVTGNNAGLVEITPQGVTNTIGPPSTAVGGLDGLTVGPDGALWFTDTGRDQIGRIDPSSLTSLPTDHILSAVGQTNPFSSATNPLEFTGSVATLYDSNTTGVASDYTATIDWGDGSTSAGTITETNPGTFNITGDHVYAQAGTFTLVITVADTNPNVTPQPNQTSTTTTTYVGNQTVPTLPGGPVTYNPVPVLIVAAPGAVDSGSTGTPKVTNPAKTPPKTPTPSVITTLPNIKAVVQLFEKNLIQSVLDKAKVTSPFAIKPKSVVMTELSKAAPKTIKPFPVFAPVFSLHPMKLAVKKPIATTHAAVRRHH